MPDDRAPRQPYRERHQDRFTPRPGGGPSARPGFAPRAGSGPARAPFTPRPAPDTVTIKLRDGDREVELTGSLAACRQLLDELPGLWSRLRPHGSAPGAVQPSIALPTLPPPAPAIESAPGPQPVATAAREGHRRDRHSGERAARAHNGQASNGAAASLDEQVVAILRAARRPVGIAEIRARLSEDVSGQAVRRILERTAGVANVGGRPAAYRLR